MTEPRYVGLQKDEIPSFTVDGGHATIHLIAGSWDGHGGPIESLTGVNIMTVELAAAAASFCPLRTTERCSSTS